MSSGLTRRRVTFVDVMRVREFRVLWFADSQSAVGDQLARVALSALVFQRTSSAVLTGLTYSLTFFPALLSGALLSSLADRLPRRRVLIGCDVIRAVLFGAMALPNVPFWLLAALLVLAILAESPFIAAESALIPLILPDEDLYLVGTGIRTITNQIAQLIGFAGGGLAIAILGARAGLALDGATFALSGVLIWIGVQARPAAQTKDPQDEVVTRSSSALSAGLRLVFHDPRLRTLLGLSWLAGLYVVPEGVAAPYTHALHHGSSALGFLMAANPTGVALGTYLFVRWVPSRLRSSLMAPLGMTAGLPLLLCLPLPPLPISILLWGASGFFFCYQVQVVTEFMRSVPDDQRGQAAGIASSGLLVVQGVGVLLGGVVAELWGVRWAVSGAGVLGMLLALSLGVMWSRANLQDSRASAVAVGPRHRKPAARPNTRSRSTSRSQLP
ncbi:MAG TPA: MFS transporter [Jatrophihabitans sp.]|nr:MFS transporter [Jatrophihabitans sp.]